MAYLGDKFSFTRELLLIVFILLPLTLSFPKESTLKDQFEEFKQLWLQQKCNFPEKSALGLGFRTSTSVFGKIEQENFPLKVCSDNNESSKKEKVCGTFFEVSKLLCSNKVSAVEKQSLDPAHLDSLIKATGTQELCADTQAINLALFSWLNEAQNGCSKCEDAELKPVCDLMFAAVLSYFQAHTQSSASGTGSSGNAGPAAGTQGNNSASAVTQAPNNAATGTQAPRAAAGQGTTPQAASPPKNITSGPGHAAVAAVVSAVAAASAAKEGSSPTTGGNPQDGGNTPSEGRSPLGGGSSVSGGNVSVSIGDSPNQGESQPGNMVSVDRIPPGSVSSTVNDAENYGKTDGGNQPDSMGTASGVGNQPGTAGLANEAGNLPGTVGLEIGTGNQPGTTPSTGLANGAGNLPGTVALENGAGNQPGSLVPTSGAGNQPGSLVTTSGAGNQSGSLVPTSGAGNQPVSLVPTNGAGNQPPSVGLQNGAGIQPGSVGLENEAGNQPGSPSPSNGAGNQLGSLELQNAGNANILGGKGLAGGQPVVGTSTTRSTIGEEDDDEEDEDVEFLENEKDRNRFGTDMDLQRPGPQNPTAGKSPTIPEDGVQNFNNVLEYNFKEEESPSGHFMAYFITAIILCVAGYVIYHNKQKIYAIALEGRRETPRRRAAGGNESSAKYSKLQSTVEDVVPALEKSTTSKNYIY